MFKQVFTNLLESGSEYRTQCEQLSKFEFFSENKFRTSQCNAGLDEHFILQYFGFDLKTFIM